MRICPLCFERSADEAKHCPRDTTMLLQLGDSTQSPLIGTVAAERFLLVDLIGQGGMASVFRAYQLSMSRFVAVKVLGAPDMGNQVVVERFIREARSTAQLRSPHTVVVHDFGQLASGELFLVMELLEGPTLEKVIAASKKLTPQRAARLAAQICGSLEEAHQLGMIHRDIKPRNIIVEHADTRDERAKVLDFGLVKLTETPDFALTRAGVIHGTPPYMAPEMWSDDYGGPSAATDIYALGITLYEMIASRLPFRGTSMPGFARMHCFDPIPTLPGSDSDLVLSRLDKIIHRCLDKVPDNRWASAAELRMELEALDASQDVFAPEPSASGFLDTYPSEVPAEQPMPPPLASEPGPSKLRLMLPVAVLALLAAGTFALRALVSSPPEIAPVIEPERPPPAIPIAPPPPPVVVAEEEAPAKAAKKSPSKPKVERARVVEVSVAGALESSSAKKTIDALSSDLLRCLTLAYPSQTQNLSVRFFLKPDGSTTTVRVTPNDEGAARFRTCLEPALRQRRFDVFDGPFSTVTVVLAP
jgi:eukaryotic-like serine/threonine-protein kinase